MAVQGMGKLGTRRRKAVEQLVCGVCQRQLDAEAFPWRDKGRRLRRKRCLECVREYNRQWQAERVRQERLRVEGYFSGLCCGLCGEHAPACLDFYSRDEHALVNLVKKEWSYEHIVEHMDILSVICRNCYAKVSAMGDAKSRLILGEIESLLEAPDDLDFDVPTKPNQPTNYLPGTTSKVEVMRMRYERRQPVLNDGDAKPCLD